MLKWLLLLSVAGLSSAYSPLGEPLGKLHSLLKARENGDVELEAKILGGKKQLEDGKNKHWGGENKHWGGEKKKRENKPRPQSANVIKFVMNSGGEWVPTVVIEDYVVYNEEREAQNIISAVDSAISKSTEGIGETIEKFVEDDLQSILKDHLGLNNGNFLESHLLENTGSTEKIYQSTREKKSAKEVKLEANAPGKPILKLKQHQIVDGHGAFNENTTADNFRKSNTIFKDELKTTLESERINTFEESSQKNSLNRPQKSKRRIDIDSSDIEDLYKQENVTGTPLNQFLTKTKIYKNSKLRIINGTKDQDDSKRKIPESPEIKAIAEEVRRHYENPEYRSKDESMSPETWLDRFYKKKADKNNEHQQQQPAATTTTRPAASHLSHRFDSRHSSQSYRTQPTQHQLTQQQPTQHRLDEWTDEVLANIFGSFSLSRDTNSKPSGTVSPFLEVDLKSLNLQASINETLHQLLQQSKQKMSRVSKILDTKQQYAKLIQPFKLEEIEELGNNDKISRGPVKRKVENKHYNSQNNQHQLVRKAQESQESEPDNLKEGSPDLSKVSQGFGIPSWDFPSFSLFPKPQTNHKQANKPGDEPFNAEDLPSFSQNQPAQQKFYLPPTSKPHFYTPSPPISKTNYHTPSPPISKTNYYTPSPHNSEQNFYPPSPPTTKLKYFPTSPHPFLRTYSAPTTPPSYPRFSPPALPPAYRSYISTSPTSPAPLRTAKFPLLPLDSDQAPLPQHSAPLDPRTRYYSNLQRRLDIPEHLFPPVQAQFPSQEKVASFLRSPKWISEHQNWSQT